MGIYGAWPKPTEECVERVHLVIHLTVKIYRWAFYRAGKPLIYNLRALCVLGSKS